MFEVIIMPYDYDEYLKKQRDDKQYTESAALVIQILWSETINFKLSQEWLDIEDRILIMLYLRLRYT